MRVAALILAGLLTACSPAAESPTPSRVQADSRLAAAVSGELKTDRAWELTGETRQLRYGGVTYEVRPISGNAAELRAVLPPDADDAQTGRAVQTVLAAGAGQHRAGVDLLQIADAFRHDRPLPSRVVNGVEIWREGDVLIARPVTAP